MRQFLGKTNVPVLGWTEHVPVDDKSLAQLLETAAMPFIHKHIAVMPDVHYGMGATVGSVIPTKGAIIPAAVGVDIGCGMNAVRTNLRAEHLPDNLKDIRIAIEKAVPHGRTTVGKKYDPSKDRGLWGDAPDNNLNAYKHLHNGLQDILTKQEDKLLDRAAKGAVNQLGTLGTGNHFVELCLDEYNQVWIMLHSGSRGIGNRIGMHFIEKARNLCEKWFVNLPNKDLAFLPESIPEFDEYIEAVSWAQEFAKTNRAVMMSNVIQSIKGFFPDLEITKEAINCHHNYISRENHFGSNVWVTRKGAVRAREGDLGIIPGSMGAKSFIVKGKGNKDSFCTCSHGAGRVMSRMEAKRQVSIEEHIKDTEGVECRKDASVLDETPKAYKDIDAVMKSQEDLVEILHTLKQVVCVKG